MRPIRFPGIPRMGELERGIESLERGTPTRLPHPILGNRFRSPEDSPCGTTEIGRRPRLGSICARAEWSARPYSCRRRVRRRSAPRHAGKRRSLLQQLDLLRPAARIRCLVPRPRAARSGRKASLVPHERGAPPLGGRRPLLLRRPVDPGERSDPRRSRTSCGSPSTRSATRRSHSCSESGSASSRATSGSTG